jgi:hypothetical protein
MGDLLGSLVWGAKSGQYCVIGGGSLQMVSEPLPSMRWWFRAQAQRGLPAGTCWDAKNGVIPWGSPARTLGPKGGWLWRPTSPGNEDVLICINAPYMTQRVLKPWWQWTYQNSAVKRATARAIPGWVTSWEVRSLIWGAKSGQYCVNGGGSLQLLVMVVYNYWRCIARDANVECHFIWYEVKVKRSASFEVLHDSREDCTRSKWTFTT